MFSAASGRGLIEAARISSIVRWPSFVFSAASGRGLIEAPCGGGARVRRLGRFPRHRAAASLKRRESARRADHVDPAGFPRHRAAASLKHLDPDFFDRRDLFSAASGRGLIEAPAGGARGGRSRASFSAASGRGLIEAPLARPSLAPPRAGFPRHRAAASLKRRLRRGAAVGDLEFSAASGRGLIEAAAGPCPAADPGGFPRHRAAASLKRAQGGIHAGFLPGFPRHRAAASLKRSCTACPSASGAVFRGIGPRPHEARSGSVAAPRPGPGFP